jgi:general secretion pathway protein G
MAHTLHHASGMKPPHASERGVTLVEVLIVIALIALISAGAAIAVAKLVPDQKRKIAETEARTTRQLAQSYVALGNAVECPSVSDLLKEGLIDDSSRTVDPWQNPYRITCTEGRMVVSSNGPDRTLGTPDDISVPAAQTGQAP